MSGTHRPARTLVVLAVLGALLPLAAAMGSPADAVEQPWSRTASRPDATRPLTVSPSRYDAYALDRAALLDELARGRVEVPDPDGTLVAFRVARSTVMEAGLAAAHPELATWAGTAVAGGAAIRLEVTPGGVHVAVRGDGPSWYVDPAYRDDDSLHLSYLGTDLPSPERGLVEPPLPARTQAQVAARADAAPAIGEGPGALAQLRTYRLALISDPTYAAFVAPGAATNAASDLAVLAAKTVLVDRLDQIYGADLGIRLVLVDHTDTSLNLWTSAEASGANGPCGLSACYPAAVLAGGCTLPVLDRNRWVIGQLVGARSYDVGHLALGINGGGLAYLDAVGQQTKAGGCTGLTTPFGDAYTVDYLAHELGHQFGADHTFEGTAGGCSGTRAADSAVEPGSGSTIMGYAGICGADDLQGHSDPVFSTVSRGAVDGYVRAGGVAVSEWQSVAFSGFDGTDAFQLKVGAATTATITHGTGYTAANLKSALMAVLPAGSSVQVRPFFDEFAFDERGFELYYVLYGGSFAVDVPDLSVVPVAGTFTASANDIDAGNPAATAAGTVTTPGNHNPTVTAPADRTIPVRTPFSLTGSASDADGNALGYVWEQTDTTGSATGTTVATQPRTGGPLFRVFGTASSSFANVPGASGLTRSFPDLAQVVAGTTNADTGSCPAGAGQVDCLSETLPTTSYAGTALHLRLTARDAVAAVGGVASDDVVLTLDKTKGPFRVLSQATTPGSPLAGGSTQTVTWTTGTSTLAATVRITLSTDGGLTFPTVLTASTPNNGSAQVTLPNVAAGAARIRVEAVGNYFYDVNDAPFAIQASGGPAPLVVDHALVPASWALQFSDPASVSFSATSGRSAPSASATGLPAGLALSAGGSPWTIGGAPTVAPGTYPATVTVTDGTETAQFGVSVVVAAEASTVTYTGPTSVVGTDPDADEVPVTVTALVTQAADGSLGPINAATVRFADTGSGATLCAAAPVTTAGTGPGTASCSFDADLSVDDVVTYHVALTVGGSYAGSSAAATTLTVSLPDEPDPVLPDTAITSGPAGWLLAPSATFGISSTVPDSTYVCRLDTVKVDCDGPSVTVAGLSQRSHRLTVVAIDPDDNRDDTPATRDFAVPVDDAGLTAVGRWRRKHSGSAYLGTYAQARRKGAALTYRVTDVRELALLVRTGMHYGAVKVYLDDALLTTVRTAGTAGARAVRVGHFATPRSGTVRIVSTSRSLVRVDGLGVSTYAF